MTGTTAPAEPLIGDVSLRIEHLIDEMADYSLPSERVRSALRAAPRHWFVPQVGLAIDHDQNERVIDRTVDLDGWLAAVYADICIVTQVNDGVTGIVIDPDRYTSSASAPSTVSDLLEWLDPEPGHRVLEVGTGTGFTAALLSHLVGAENLTSVEVDPAVAGQAAASLAAAGLRPYLVVGDGADGYPDRAPFDRVHVTCGIRKVPYAWVRQSKPGAVIVLPYQAGIGHGHGLRLVVGSDGTATGRFPGFASYMLMRSQRPVDDHTDQAPYQRLTTGFDARTIIDAPPGARLAMSAITGLRTRDLEDDDDHVLWVFDQAESARWAMTRRRPGADEHPVYQFGDRPVFQEIVDAYAQWEKWGEPGRDRFGMTVTPQGQHIWLDTPENVIG